MSPSGPAYKGPTCKVCGLYLGVRGCTAEKCNNPPEPHSPGPWTVDDRSVLMASNGDELAIVGWGKDGDAALIAAAPEMAALLRECPVAVDGPGEVNVAAGVRAWCDAVAALLARLPPAPKGTP